MTDYDESIALSDKNYVFYNNRGHLRNEKEDWNGAIADFDKAILVNPKSAEAYNGRGVARYSREESDQAIADFDKAIAIDPVASLARERWILVEHLRRREELERVARPDSLKPEARQLAVALDISDVLCVRC